MKINEEKIDNTTLALLFLTLHDTDRAWKQHDWDIMNRLYEKGLIHNPVGKAKSIMLTDEGMKSSEVLFEEMFTEE